MNKTDLRYLALGLYIGAFLVAAVWNNLDPRDEAVVLNSLATVTGVLAGLYFVVRQTRRVRKAQTFVMATLLISLFLSLLSIIHALSTPPDPFGSKVLFVVSAVTFAVSTSLFASATGLLSNSTQPN